MRRRTWDKRAILQSADGKNGREREGQTCDESLVVFLLRTLRYWFHKLWRAKFVVVICREGGLGVEGSRSEFFFEVDSLTFVENGLFERS